MMLNIVSAIGIPRSIAWVATREDKRFDLLFLDRDPHGELTFRSRSANTLTSEEVGVPVFDY